MKKGPGFLDSQCICSKYWRNLLNARAFLSVWWILLNDSVLGFSDLSNFSHQCNTYMSKEKTVMRQNAV